jgi:hypothetical protein
VLSIENHDAEGFVPERETGWLPLIDLDVLPLNDLDEIGFAGLNVVVGGVDVADGRTTTVNVCVRVIAVVGMNGAASPVPPMDAGTMELLACERLRVLNFDMYPLDSLEVVDFEGDERCSW